MMAYNEYRHFAFGHASPLGSRDTHGNLIKSSPARTVEEQAAIDDFIRSRGVTKVEPRMSGLPQEDDAPKVRDNSKINVGNALRYHVERQAKVNLILGVLSAHGKQAATALAALVGYNDHCSIYRLLGRPEYSRLVNRSSKNEFSLTDEGRKELKK